MSDVRSEIPVTLYFRSEDEAMALAQLVKRLSWSDCRALATGDDEAGLMMGSLNDVRTALADAGFSPR